MFGTRSSLNWETQPGKFDVLNLRKVFPSSNEHGIPDLKPTEFIPTTLAAWNMHRHRDYAAQFGGALHFFLDDYRFETAWSSPERLLPRVTAVGAALTPDFSLWRDMPRPAQVWNVYRKHWCGAYWQENGVEVIPTACWGTPDTFDFCFEGIPTNAVVAMSPIGQRSDAVSKALFRAGLQELIRRTEPKLLLTYGRLRYCDDIDLPEVKEYETFWDRRRKRVEHDGRQRREGWIPFPEERP